MKECGWCNTTLCFLLHSMGDPVTCWTLKLVVYDDATTILRGRAMYEEPWEIVCFSTRR